MNINFGYISDPMKQNLVRKAVEAAGGQSAVARELGIYQSAVAKWCSTGRVPAGRVLALERLSRISRHLLRPDLYPRDHGA